MRNVIFILGSLGVAGPLAAQAPAPAAPPPIVRAAEDPEAIAEARALLTAMDFNGQMEASMAQSGDRSFDTILREFEAHYGRQVPEDLVARMRRTMREGLALVAADLRPTAFDEAARVYARYFTAAEIRELRGLLTNPVMQKMQRLAPQFMGELMQIGLSASARRMPELMERIRQEVSAWERDNQRRRPTSG